MSIIKSTAAACNSFCLGIDYGALCCVQKLSTWLGPLHMTNSSHKIHFSWFPCLNTFHQNSQASQNIMRGIIGLKTHVLGHIWDILISPQNIHLHPPYSPTLLCSPIILWKVSRGLEPEQTAWNPNFVCRINVLIPCASLMSLTNLDYFLASSDWSNTRVHLQQA